MVPGYTRKGGNAIVRDQSHPEGINQILKPAVQWLLSRLSRNSPLSASPACRRHLRWEIDYSGTVRMSRAVHT